MTVFSHHPLLRRHIRHTLPPATFFSDLQGCTSPNSAQFYLIPTKIPRKNFFRRAAGCTGTPAPPGYAYTPYYRHMWLSKGLLCKNGIDSSVRFSNFFNLTLFAVSLSNSRSSRLITSANLFCIFTAGPHCLQCDRCISYELSLIHI